MRELTKIKKNIIDVKNKIATGKAELKIYEVEYKETIKQKRRIDRNEGKMVYFKTEDVMAFVMVSCLLIGGFIGWFIA